MNANLLTRSLDVLEMVVRGERVRFGDLHGALGINRTTLSKLLRILTVRGYLAKHEDGYGPGPMLPRLADAPAAERKLTERFAPVLVEMTDTWGVTSLLIVHDGPHTRFLDKQVRDFTFVGRPVGPSFPMSAALPWDLHWLRTTGSISLEAALADSNAFWAERDQPALTLENFRPYYESAGNEEGCIGLSPGFPCEARGAVPVRTTVMGTPIAYVGFITLTDPSPERQARLKQIFAAFREAVK